MSTNETIAPITVTTVLYAFAKRRLLHCDTCFGCHTVGLGLWRHVQPLVRRCFAAVGSSFEHGTSIVGDANSPTNHSCSPAKAQHALAT